MSGDSFRFGDFTFDPENRSLVRGTERIDLGSRYLDALALLIQQRGRLVSKTQFMDSVWLGVPVTDEALTQCIRTLRSQLGDDAARPRFIETVPKHGYRFVADVEPAGTRGSPGGAGHVFDLAHVLRSAGLAGAGGACAGIGGGLFYAMAASQTSTAAGIGASSVLLVFLVLNVVLGATAGAAVGAGIASVRAVPGDRWQSSTAGGMLGGLLIGAIAKLVGLDAFSLLFGGSLAGMTGPPEGAMLGAAIGLAGWVASRWNMKLWRSAAVGGAAAGLAGLLVVLLGGHLLGGSLNLLGHAFPNGRFHLDTIGSMFGEVGFGRISEAMTAVIEGALLGAGIVAALSLSSSRGTPKASSHG